MLLRCTSRAARLQAVRCVPSSVRSLSTLSSRPPLRSPLLLTSSPSSRRSIVSSPSPSITPPSSLTAYFDLPSSSQSHVSSSPSTGLFGQPRLTSPSGLRTLSAETNVQAQAILKRIKAAPHVRDDGGREMRMLVKNFDRLSDKLCGVIDLCESIYTSHPEQRWKNEAGRVYEELCRVMNEMNVDVELYEALLLATETPAIASHFTSEEAQTAAVLLHDFQKSGIHLEPSQRSHFVDLSEQVIGLGRQFQQNIASPPPAATNVVFEDASMLKAGLGESFVRRVKTGRRGQATVDAAGWEGQMVLRKGEDEEARRRVWMAQQGGGEKDQDRVRVLEELLGTRAKLAGLVGRGSWGEVELENKMAKSPAHVTQFLSSLSTSNHPPSLTELSTLSTLKQSHLSLSSQPTLNPWDRDFYLQRASFLASSSTTSLPSLSPYFSVGTILNGLSTLFTSLYGVSFRPCPAAPGETWDPSVRKLEVVDEQEGVVGYVYCDLFSREGKQGNAAHYTVRCSRRVDDDDLKGDEKYMGKQVGEGRWGSGIFGGGKASGQGAGGGGLEVMPVKAKGRDGSFQLPIAVLNCDFALPTFIGGPTLLSYQEVETIFHEMGHAMHSMLARTSLHSISGTRVPTDLAELPSIFHESFCHTPHILSLLTSHHTTHLPPPPALLQAHAERRASFPALENATQIHMALLDQGLHSIAPGAGRVDSTEVNRRVTDGMGLLPFVPGTAPQVAFGHLFGYGASYYSYLFDRAIAGRIWEQVFREGAVVPTEGKIGAGGLEGLREGGERMKEGLLRWGGGKDGWEMVGDVLGDEEVKRGDGRAMEKVGRWGVGGTTGTG